MIDIDYGFWASLLKGFTLGMSIIISLWLMEYFYKKKQLDLLRDQLKDL